MRFDTGLRALVATMALASLMLGCQGSNNADGTSPDADHDHAHHDHDEHGELGPHGGHLIELGDEEYHAELVHDEEGGGTAVTVYILDGEAVKQVPIELQSIKINVASQEGAPRQFELMAVGGKPTASAFSIEDARLAAALKDEHEADCKLSVTIAGKQYVGRLEHDHQHH